MHNERCTSGSARGHGKPTAVTPHGAHDPTQPYLQAAVRGRFYYLYMTEDIWSRMIVGWEVHEEESMDLASSFIDGTCSRLDLDPTRLTLHSDNGGPMKGSTMLATLQRLGIAASFSRPSVSDDNPFSEALFRTMKYRPAYPRRPFDSIAAARSWVAKFVTWYNTQHRHSAIRFVTPQQRHLGTDLDLLEARRHLYEQARRQHPARWSRACRNWTPIHSVRLNPGKSLKEVADRVA